MRITIITILFLFIQSPDTLRIEANQLMELERAKVYLDLKTQEQEVLLFHSGSCFPCIPELVEDFNSEGTKFLYQTGPLTSLAKKSLIQRFEFYGLDRKEVILFINPDKKRYYKRYEKAILKKLDAENYTLSFKK